MTTAITVQDLGREKIELIKQTVAKGATDLELELFLHACNRTGLDPLMKQIYAIPRWNSDLKRNVLAFQTGIDGYRLIADRTGKYAGSSDAIYEELDGVPLLAQVTVLKIVNGEKCAFTASARWEEYAQKKQNGEPTAMWSKMPYLMLAKCAEALALRKAFPAELSGVYTHEEMMQADTEPRKPLRTPSQILAESEHKAAPSSVLEPQTSEMLAEIQHSVQASHAPRPTDDPPVPGHGETMEQYVERHRVTLRTCERDSKAITHAFNAIPDEIRQDCFPEYQAQLKSLNKKK